MATKEGRKKRKKGKKDNEGHGQYPTKAGRKLAEVPYISQLLERRLYSNYTKGKKDPRDKYEPPKSKREWWRVPLKATPVPGTYATRDFLDVAAMNPVQPTYNFAGQGRAKDAGIARSGGMLLPGAYAHTDFLWELKNKKIATSFKSSGRKQSPTGFRDKDLDVPPWHYELLPAPVEKIPVKHSSFKSQSSRFPSPYFKPKDGPPPGAYNPCLPTYRYKITSSFCSATPRFGTSVTRVPGPGTYDATSYAKPQQPTLKKMAKMHGLYFKQTFET